MDRIAIAIAHWIYADWYNVGGLTDRCRDHRNTHAQLERMGFRPAPAGFGDVADLDDDVYQALYRVVDRYEDRRMLAQLERDRWEA